MNKQPEQTAKTRQTMIDAFWSLAVEQGLDNVTITAITRKAGLNRGTFYVYFADMPDLIAQAEDEIIEHLKARLRASIEGGGLDNFEVFTEKYLDVLAQYDDKVFFLIGKNGDPNFRSVVIGDAVKMFREVFRPTDAPIISEHIVAYLASAGLGLLAYWHETGKRISLTELAKIFHTLATQGIRSVVANTEGYDGNSG